MVLIIVTVWEWTLVHINNYINKKTKNQNQNQYHNHNQN